MPIRIPAIGIDLGHGNVKVAYPASNAVRTLVFPAVAANLGGRELREFDDTARSDGVKIDVDGRTYFVGPDAARRQKGIATKISQEGYCHTSQYQALMLGAIALAAAACGAREGGEVEILCLGLGLPLTTYWTERAGLEQAWKGWFEVPLGASTVRVHVRETTVLAQPVGGLIKYADGALSGKSASETEALLSQFNTMHSLVLDAGGGTLDYLVAEGGVRLNPERSGANVNAMEACARAVAERCAGDSLEKWLGNQKVLSRIGESISKKQSFEANPVGVVPLEKYWPAVESIVDQGLDEALNKVGDLSDIQLVLVVGGGGRVFSERFKKRKPEMAHRVQEMGDPLFTNVLGFYAKANLKAESLARSLRLAPAEVA